MSTPEELLLFLNEQDPAMYREVVQANQYRIDGEKIFGRTIIDIGANIGAFTLYSALLGAKKVVSVEPVSASYNRLLKNIHRLNLKNVTTFKNLIHRKNNLFLPVSLNDNAGANSIYNVNDDNFEVVETIAFFDVIGKINDSNIFLKIDCEGAEYDVILHTDNYHWDKISEIVIEMHTEMHPEYKGKEILMYKLQSLGFKLISDNQTFLWDYDQFGNRVNWRPLALTNQYWKK